MEIIMLDSEKCGNFTFCVSERQMELNRKEVKCFIKSYSVPILD